MISAEVESISDIISNTNNAATFRALTTDWRIETNERSQVSTMRQEVTPKGDQQDKNESYVKSDRPGLR